MRATVLSHRTVEPSEVFCALLFGYITVELSEVFCALLFSVTIVPTVLLDFLKVFGALRISVPVVFVRLFL